MVRETREEQKGTELQRLDFKNHFQQVSKDRYELTPNEIMEAVNTVRDVRRTRKAKEANNTLNETPNEDEIRREMKNVKDSAPGKDQVRMIYINEASEEVKTTIIKTVQYMFEKRAHRWEEELKEGHMVPIFKKGDRNNTNNYRGVCLLAMCSRILGRVLATRLRWWSEHMELTDENQSGFREGRSTADATQVLIRIEEDTEDIRKRRRQQGQPEEKDGDPAARLLDLRKAYPRVNKPALWKILERYGLRGNFVDSYHKRYT